MSENTSEAYSHQRGRGRDAKTPTEIPSSGWKDVAWRVYTDAAQILEITLSEERATDQALSQLAEGGGDNAKAA